MVFKFQMAAQAKNDLQTLDESVARRIAIKLRFFAARDNPLHFAKRLKNSAYGDFRFRVGDYRIIFDCDARGTITILTILRIRHRREAYD